MRFCPVCRTRYDEEIIKFCTKDGTPLVEENPGFTALPSQTSIEDFGEETVIRRNTSENATEQLPVSDTTARQKIVIPTAEEKRQPPQSPPPVIRPAETAVNRQPPRKSNTALTVLLTVFGTLAVLAGAGGVWRYMSKDGKDNTGVNVNVNAASNSNVAVNTNTDSNLFANTNIDANINSNVNANANFNINIAPTPRPTQTPRPTPTPTPTVKPNTNTNVGNIGNVNTSVNSNLSVNGNRPVSNTIVVPTPRPSVTPPANQTVNVGIINSRAASLPKPAYPPIAKQMGASGQVSVQVTVDENGNVISAKAISGNALLRPASEAAARQSRFNPVKIGDRPVRAVGTIIYNFINQ